MINKAYLIPFLSVGVGAFVCFWWMLSEGTWHIYGTGFRGPAYDYLAQSLLNGQAVVPCSLLDFEALEVDGKCFMYFGPWPAIVRLPWILSSGIGVHELSRVSCLIAGGASIVALGILLSGSIRRSPFYNALIFFAACLGTPFFFLSLSAALFHEANSWGLAGALLCAAGAVRCLQSGDRLSGWLFLSSVGCGISLLSRLSTSLSALVMMLVLVPHIWRHGRRRPGSVIVLLLPTLTAIVLQVWYNVARFGSVFKVLAGPEYEKNVKVARGLFNLGRLPEHLRIYMIGDERNLSAVFPFLKMAIPRYEDPSIFYAWREPSVPWLFASPWLLFLFGISVFALYRKRNYLALFGVFALLACSVPVLTHLFSSHRYTTEFIPIFLFPLALSLFDSTSVVRSVVVRILAGVLIAVSVSVSIINDACWVSQWAGGAPWFSQDFRVRMQQQIPSCGEPLGPFS
jgi:hypothetical protein